MYERRRRERSEPEMRRVRPRGFVAPRPAVRSPAHLGVSRRHRRPHHRRPRATGGGAGTGAGGPVPRSAARAPAPGQAPADGAEPGRLSALPLRARSLPSFPLAALLRSRASGARRFSRRSARCSTESPPICTARSAARPMPPQELRAGEGSRRQGDTRSTARAKVRRLKAAPRAAASAGRAAASAGPRAPARAGRSPRSGVGRSEPDRTRGSP